jgi:ADP-heptose:LPS heptosyltransferase
MIKVLKEESPEVTIDVACMFDGVGYLFEHNPNVRRVHYLPLYKQPLRDGLRHVRRLRRERYDLSIVAFPAFRKEYHAVARLIGARRRVAHRFSRGSLREWHFVNTDLVRVDASVHNVVNNLNLLHPLGIRWEQKYNPQDLRYDLVVDSDALRAGREYLEAIGWSCSYIVGVHPGSIDSKAGLYKRWPTECWVQLIDELIATHDKRVLVFFGDLEEEIAREILMSVKHPSKCKAVTGLSFRESLGVLAHVETLVSNDNGFAHLANALRVKGIVLFGPTNLTWCAPYDRRLATGLRRATFSPWFVNDMKVTRPPRGAQSGMAAIRPDDVLQSFVNHRLLTL